MATTDKADNTEDDPNSKSPTATRGRALSVIGIAAPAVIVLIALAVSGITGARNAAYRNRCTCHGKQLGIALLNYHDVNKSFPPAFVADINGKPMHSWRVLLLPYLEENELYRAYNFNEPWNGPHNSRLSDMMPSQYRCPMTKGGTNETSYSAVVGPETAWPGNQSMTIKAMRDGTSHTIMLVEVANSGINWLDPRDLSFDQALQGVNPPDKNPAISSLHSGGALAIFADAHVLFIPDDVRTNFLRERLTAAGHDTVSIPDN